MNVLHSIRVLDLGNFITGPYAAMLLAELGADVVKVERPGTGDPFRSFEGGLYSPHFQSYNRHKRSVTLDYSKPEGLEILRKLVSNADVVVLNNRPGVSEKLGVDYERLHAINRRLVYCSITGFGSDGPYASRPAYDNVGQTLSGWLSLFHDGGDPRVAGPAVSDALTGVFACMGILAALFDREKSGAGRKVDISMLEATMAFGAEPIGQYLATGQTPTRYSRGATSQAYLLECRDGKRVGLQLSSPNKFWESLANAIERPDFLQKYPDRKTRISSYEEIAKELAEIFKKRTRDEWMAVLEKNDVPFAPERKISELFDDPQILHLNLLFKSTHPVHGDVKGMRRPVRFDGQREAQLRAPPDLSEHTGEVLEELGISEDRRNDLRTRGLI